MDQDEQKAKTLECPKCKSHRIVRERKRSRKKTFFIALAAIVLAPFSARDVYEFRCKDCGWQDHFMPE